MHQFWTCTHNQHIDDPRVATTQDLIPLAEAEADIFPCLWLRGLLPSSRIVVPRSFSPVVSTQYTYIGGWNSHTQLQSGTYFTDASGGLDHDIPQLRRCGIGICASPSLHPPQAPDGLHYPLPGEVQTVPRGELHAIVTVARLAALEADILVYSDNLQVVRHCQGEGISQSLNHDLLEDLSILIKEKRLTFKVVWIKSHLPLWQPDQWPPEVTNLQVFGNHYADKYAGEAARKYTLPADITSPIRQTLHLVTKIQWRLAAILCNLPARQLGTHRPQRQPRIPHPPPLYTKFDASRHQVFEVDGRLHCTYCQSSVPTRNRLDADAWLDTNCNCKVVRVGNKYTHSTHNIQSLKGLIFCVKCGLLATQQLKGLADPCQCTNAAYAKPHAKVTLRRLARGLLPHGLSSAHAHAQWKLAWAAMRDKTLAAQPTLIPTLDNT